MKTWYIEHSREGSINLGDRIRHEVHGTYQDAVTKAHEIWKSMESKCGVSVHSNHHCIYFWHYIDGKGNVTDRNTNSGVQYPTEYKTKYVVGKGYITE